MSKRLKIAVIGAIAASYLTLAKADDHSEIAYAEVVCKTAFEERAKNPSSVEWIRSERQFKFTNDAKTKAISIQPVRAKNGFNATVKGAATCELEKLDGRWKLVSIK